MLNQGRKMVRPGGLELPTFCFVGRRSIQLSYGRTSNALNIQQFTVSSSWIST